MVGQMKASPSIGVVWQLAAREAMAAAFDEILPEHFLNALLKFSELPVESLDKVAPEAAESMLVSEVEELRAEFGARGVNSKTVRRQLRRALGEGTAPGQRSEIHRSQSARKMFDVAGDLAGQSGKDVLTACHLVTAILGSPTQLVKSVLGAAAGNGPALADALKDIGEDLARAATDGSLPPHEERDAEARTIESGLLADGPRGVFVVTDSVTAFSDVVHQLAHRLVRGKGKFRLVDSRRPLASINNGWASEDLTKLLGGASDLQGVCVVLPASGTPRCSPRQVLETLATSTEQGCPPWICHVPVAIHRELLASSPYWDSVARSIWIQDGARGDIPDEL